MISYMLDKQGYLIINRWVRLLGWVGGGGLGGWGGWGRLGRGGGWQGGGFASRADHRGWWLPGGLA